MINKRNSLHLTARCAYKRDIIALTQPVAIN